MPTDILTHLPTDEKYAVYDVTESSFKSRDIPYNSQWKHADSKDYALNGVQIEITKSSIGFKNLEVEYRHISQDAV
jgi:hypothetical protein